MTLAAQPAVTTRYDHALGRRATARPRDGQSGPRSSRVPGRDQRVASARRGPPPSNAGWAVAAILFFWPLAFSAFNHLHNIYPRWAMGDVAGAEEASDRVKSLGKIALWIVGRAVRAAS